MTAQTEKVMMIWMGVQFWEKMHFKQQFKSRSHPLHVSSSKQSTTTTRRYKMPGNIHQLGICDFGHSAFDTGGKGGNTPTPR